MQLPTSWQQPAFAAVYLLCGLVIVLGMYALGVLLGLPRWAAVVVALLFGCSPAAIVYENVLFYPYLVATGLTVTFVALFLYLRDGRARWGLLAFSAAAAVVMTRATYHLVWLFALVAVVLLARPKDRHRDAAGRAGAGALRHHHLRQELGPDREFHQQQLVRAQPGQRGTQRCTPWPAQGHPGHPGLHVARRAARCPAAGPTHRRRHRRPTREEREVPQLQQPRIREALGRLPCRQRALHRAAPARVRHRCHPLAALHVHAIDRPADSGVERPAPAHLRARVRPLRQRRARTFKYYVSPTVHRRYVPPPIEMSWFTLAVYLLALGMLPTEIWLARYRPTEQVANRWTLALASATIWMAVASTRCSRRPRTAVSASRPIHWRGCWPRSRCSGWRARSPRGVGLADRRVTRRPESIIDPTEPPELVELQDAHRPSATTSAAQPRRAADGRAG